MTAPERPGPGPFSQTEEAESRLAARSAWHGTLVASGLNVVGNAIELLIVLGHPLVPAWPALTSATIGAALVVLLLVRRRRASIALSRAVFLVNIAVIAASLWITNPLYAMADRPWVPFQANKLGCLVVALVAPGPWAGLAAITIFGAGALVQLMLFPPELRQRIALGEPWATVAFTVFGFVLLWYRLSRMKLERQLIREQAAQVGLERMGRAFLAIRDLANTPLQIIELSIALVRLRRLSEAEPMLDRIERALARLRRLSQVLARYEREVPWRSEDLSFDAMEHLEKGLPANPNGR